MEKVKKGGKACLPFTARVKHHAQLAKGHATVLAAVYHLREVRRKLKVSSLRAKLFEPLYQLVRL